MEERPSNDTHLLDVHDVISEFVSNQELRDALIFQELLIIARIEKDEKFPTPVGGVCLNIQYSLKDKTNILIYLHSQFNVNGRKAGSKISSWLDKHLKTIEEKRVEWIDSGDKAHQPAAKTTLYSSLQKDHIHVRRHNSWSPAEKTQYPIEIHDNLINEGADFILMRLLAITKTIGQFQTNTFYITGQLCRSVYHCLGPESGLVNKKKMDICHIYRRVIEECGVTHVSKTTLTTTGRLIQHEWNGCDYVMHINPLEDLSSDGKQVNEKVNWCEDLQLLSTYLDRKELGKSKLETYLSDRGDIKNVLGDYMQSVLQMKPSNVLEFTQEYFSRFKKANEKSEDDDDHKKILEEFVKYI